MCWYEVKDKESANDNDTDMEEETPLLCQIIVQMSVNSPTFAVNKSHLHPGVSSIICLSALH